PERIRFEIGTGAIGFAAELSPEGHAIGLPAQRATNHIVGPWLRGVARLDRHSLFFRPFSALRECSVHNLSLLAQSPLDRRRDSESKFTFLFEDDGEKPSVVNTAHFAVATPNAQAHPLAWIGDDPRGHIRPTKPPKPHPSFRIADKNVRARLGL